MSHPKKVFNFGAVGLLVYCVFGRKDFVDKKTSICHFSFSISLNQTVVFNRKSGL